MPIFEAGWPQLIVTMDPLHHRSGIAPNSFWPIILAFGFVLIIGGLAIHFSMSIAGLIITFVSAIGWVIEPIHPEEGHH